MQSELRGINSLLKLDPGNTELLSQKQKVLAESISTTKDKLETLKSVQEQVNRQFENGEIGEKEFRDFQREIESTEQKLKGLETEMKNFGSVSVQQIAAAGEKVKEVGGDIEKAGKAFAPVSAAAAGLEAASVAAFKSLDNGYDIIVRATGATGDALEGLKKSANNVFGTMNVDMITVGSAIGEVNTRFQYTDTQLEKTTSLFLKFSDITGQDVVAAVGNTHKIMQAWNVDASKTEELLGLIAGKAQETGISVDTLENSVMSNSATFKEMGLSLEQSIGLMAQFEANGVDSTTAISGLKKAVQNATKEGLTADEALARTINSIKHAGSETEALNTAAELFGNKGAAEMVRAIQEGRLSFDDLKVSMESYADTVSNTYEATQDPMDKLQIAFNNVKLAGASLGASILETAQPMIDKLVSGAQSLAEWFNNLSDGAKRMIVIVMSITAAIAPLLTIIGKATSSIGSIMTLAPKISSAFSGITGAIGLSSGAILGIVAAIGVLVAAFATLWNTNSEFREKILDVWQQIKDSFQGVCDKIVELFQSLGFNVENIGDVIKTIWQGLCDFLAPIFETVWNQIGTILSSAFEVIEGILDVFIGIFTGDWSRVWDGVKEIFVGVWDFITGTFESWYTAFTGIFGNVLGMIGETWTNAWNGIKETAANIWNGIVSFFTEGIPNFISNIIQWLGNMLTNVKTWAGNMASSAKEMAKNFFNNVVNTIKDLPGKLAEYFKNTVSKAAAWVKDMAAKGKEAVTQLISNVVSAAKSIPGKMLEIGKSIVTGVWDGICKAKDWFVGKVKDFFDGIVDDVKLFLGIHSPSKVFAKEVGKWIPPGVGEGIEDNAEAAITPLQKLFDDMIGNNSHVSQLAAGSVSESSPADYSSILSMLTKIADRLGDNKIYLDGKKLVGGIIKDIDNSLSDISRQKARGM